MENLGPSAWHGANPRPYSCRSHVRPVRFLRRSAAPDSYDASVDRGARGARAGPPPPRHVYRRHRRARAPPPRRRGHRQCDGRGGRRPRQPHRGHARARQPPDRHRQRPRHPGRPAPQISGQVGARSDPDHAPLGRQVRGQGLFDLAAASTASASASSTRCRPRRSSRSRATRSSTARPSPRASPPRSSRKSAPPPTAAAPPSPSPPTPRSSAPTPTSTRPASTSSPAPRPICSPGSRSAGAATRRSPATTSPNSAVFQFPGGLADHLARAAWRPRMRHHPALRRPAGLPRRAGLAPNGRSPGRCGARAASKAIIATPSRPPTAAPTKRACAPR